MSPGCNVQTFTADTPGHLVTCTAKNDADLTTSASVRIRVDRTPPSVAAAAERPPDANGWYNHPLTVSFSARDATSGVASCSPPVRYAGPDAGNASVAGLCSDQAGNVATTTVPFSYDATPPTLSELTATPGNRSMQLAWRASSDTKAVEIVRAPGRNGEGESGVYQGTARGFLDTGLTVGRKYDYRIVGVDDAANRAEQSQSIVATGALLSPVPGARVTAPPRLVWTPVRRATYYNVQIIRGRKVLSVWPVRPNFQLRRTWTYKGRRYRLQPGVYRWYVWPGLGRRSANRYGTRLGSSTFVVAE